MNPVDYVPRAFLYSQTDFRWNPPFRPIKVALSGRSIKDIGCALSCQVYIINRAFAYDIKIGNYVEWVNKKGKASNYTDYITSDGNTYWNNVDKYTFNKLVHTYNKDEANYGLYQVRWGGIHHWIVKLDGDLCYNPYGGTIEKLDGTGDGTKKPKWFLTGRAEYYKRNV